MSRHVLIALVFFLVIAAESFGQVIPRLIPYRKSDLWGYADSSRKIIITPKYNRTFPFVHGKALVETVAGKVNQIDSTGRIVKTFPFRLNEYIGDGLLKMRIGPDKEGIVAVTGKTILEAKYDFIEAYGTDSFVVYLAGKKASYNQTGQLLVPFRETSEDVMSLMMIPNTRPSGDCEKPCLWQNYREEMAVVAHKGKFGYADTSKRIVIPCKYQMAESFLYGLGRVTFTKPGQPDIPDKTDTAGVVHVYSGHLLEEGYVDRRGTKYWED